MQGRPISEAPRDGTIIVASIMRTSGVPETGHHSFHRLHYVSLPGDDYKSWYAIESTRNLSICYGDNPTSVLAWWPDGTPEDQMEKRERTNFKWQPSNGTSGMSFTEEWCERCVKDRAHRLDENASGCDILCRTMAYSIGDPEYPEEWTNRDGEPKCTAFVREIIEIDENGFEVLKEPRCTNTKDLFE